MQIGVFDSGRGGELIAAGLRTLLPDHDFVVINDRENVPYGSRSNEEIISLTTAAIQPLLATCPIIVIACNTATMAAISSLRESHPSTLFVGTEPMIKPAGETSKSRRVTVLATPLTLQSERYQLLKARYAGDLQIDEPNTLHWARDIEEGQIDAIDLGGIAESITSGSDKIILACTHYLALKPRLQAQFPTIEVLEPTKAIAQQIARLSEQVQR
jgi:glutamate racemase